ncbi:MAG: chemotaxis protein CheA [Limnobacter sp.]|jgi:two-component system, chemotaxis family, sensor kinase CheA|uniref:chemotaxis protein CheA n=1 Tax=unclassified Limnobacter TaxID=2630203 RepID=UPI000C5D312E|nr:MULTISPECIES: chemotaxis protein CheA [unclassified Limnobacter]MBT82941.1 chemotaxis protein CheA [Sutterellaceae bacterium]PZO20673.1 MAG: chemotaxis protein CheA [Betaproteobacteria bacterium]PZO25363.1 MAG: chemotaxis protein CheA [Betaproteobacteria bacterium]|tara:strand:+ start:5844 stop:7682 length:1839 start_codon:yes stop_codon:yes gene_type:complete
MSAFSDVELLQDFLTEAGDLLEDVDSKLVELEQSPEDADLLATVFRGFHTIKGGAGFLEATHLVELCHKTENLFDLLRSKKLVLDAEMMDSIMAATGEVHRMFGEMRNGHQPGAAPQELLEALDAAIEGRTVAPAAAPVVQVAAAVPAPSQPKTLNELAQISEDDLDWAGLYEAVVGVPPRELEQAALSTGMATEAIARQAAAAVRPKAPPPKAKAAQPAAAVQKENTIRVDTARFDQILNLSGEIGLTKNRLNCLFQAFASGASNEELIKSLDTVVGQLDMLVSDLQSAVMKARMQPVGRVFQKYSRLARDVSRQLGKDVELVIEGAETEVDKSILEELNDPLIHLVRNAVDHGIETIADRTACGKNPKGIVNLSARQTGDHIVIEIQDDGRGMRPEIIREKAVEKGLISAEEAGQLSVQESLQLIFLPGFSTKDQISDISGRGVGMDVVKTNIQRLNGRIEIQSEPGHGSTITILLPLTLAILPVLMLKLEEQIYSLPLSCVREIIPIEEDKVQYVGGKPTMVVRGEVIPLLDLATLIGRESAPTPKVGVLTISGNKACILAVDSLVGQDEVMIKPLDGVKPKGVAGATLSGEGLLVLVLELRELIEGKL